MPSVQTCFVCRPRCVVIWRHVFRGQEYIASIFKVEWCQVHFVAYLCCSLDCRTFRTWRWRRYVSPKRPGSSKLHALQHRTQYSSWTQPRETPNTVIWYAAALFIAPLSVWLFIWKWRMRSTVLTTIGPPAAPSPPLSLVIPYGLMLYSDDGDNRLSRNVGTFLPDCTASLSMLTAVRMSCPPITNRTCSFPRHISIFRIFLKQLLPAKITVVWYVMPYSLVGH
jgi:hypothetical protein